MHVFLTLIDNYYIIADILSQLIKTVNLELNLPFSLMSIMHVHSASFVTYWPQFQFKLISNVSSRVLEQ